MQEFKFTTDHLAKVRDGHFSKETFNKTVTTWDVYRKGAEAAAAVLTPEIEALKEQSYKSMCLYIKAFSAAEDASDIIAQVEDYFENTEENGTVPEDFKPTLAAAAVYLNEYELGNWPNPWVNVALRFPEPGADVLFIVDCTHSEYHGHVLAGKYAGVPKEESPVLRNSFSTPGWGCSASHWMYSPKPIKSTDK